MLFRYEVSLKSPWVPRRSPRPRERSGWQRAVWGASLPMPAPDKRRTCGHHAIPRGQFPSRIRDDSGRIRIFSSWTILETLFILPTLSAQAALEADPVRESAPKGPMHDW